MNRAILVEAIADQCGVRKSEVTKIMKAFESVVIGEVSKGEKILLSGFISIERRQLGARVGRNPQTGEVLQLEGLFAPRAALGSVFKEAVRSGGRRS
jgi:DNA-binding protein HU-beta